MTDQEDATKLAEQKAAEETAAAEAKKKADEAQKEIENQSPEQKQQAYFKRKAEEAEKMKQRAKELEDELALFKQGGQTGNDDIKQQIKNEILADKKINDFIAKYPDFEEDREKLEKYAHDPSRKGIPIEEIIAGAIGFEKFLKLGAKMKSQIEEDARNGKFGGNEEITGNEKTEQQKKAESFTEAINQIPMMKRANEALKKTL
ncbi:MAG TPA: hypothetical protein VMY59_02305 [Candidatus Thermoplasmatota archaeon]|nr:hypothetical protein [Candidatus Thermoplasmatota archaeon]